MVCVHVEITMRERKLEHGHCETRKNTWGKMTNMSTKDTYEEHFASCSGLGSID